MKMHLLTKNMPVQGKCTYWLKKYAYWIKMHLLNESFLTKKSRINFFHNFLPQLQWSRVWLVKKKIMDSYESDSYKIWQKWHIVDQDWELKIWYEIEIPLKTSARKTSHCLIAGSNFIFHQPGDAKKDVPQTFSFLYLYPSSI